MSPKCSTRRTSLRCSTTIPSPTERTSCPGRSRSSPESTGSSWRRRITAIRHLLGARVDVLVGIDDVILEGVAAGAVGWVAGLASPLPAESIVLFRLARAGQREKAEKLYQWFLPLLRMDTVPKFVQLIKLVQERMGLGNSRVRAPRLALRGAELREALETIDRALEQRPLSGD